MNSDSVSPGAAPTLRIKVDLFLISLLILFLELACIRWFPAHVLFLTFFTNTVLLACFLGMSLGCLMAGSRWSLIKATPLLLAIAIAGAFQIEFMMTQGQFLLDVGNQASPQLVYFGTEYHSEDPARFRVPVEVVNGFFFLVLALTFVGPGQLLGRALGQIPNRVQAYSIDICGSIIGIVAFTCFSALQLSPLWWFLPPAVGLAYFTAPRPVRGLALAGWGLCLLALIAVPVAADFHTGRMMLFDGNGQRTIPQITYWSPYYRVDYLAPYREIKVNLIGHQQMVSVTDPENPGLCYALPHLLNRDAGLPRFEEVLVIGAGSGNDVSRALLFGAKHVDAVEIDPVIQRLGKENHPSHPYDDERVTVHLDDGRNFLRSTDKQYDLIVFALVDSLVLHSSYSNIRLESYLFTKQAFEDVKRRLKPGGTFVMYNYFRLGWVVARLRNVMQDVFGGEPLVMAMPYASEIPEENLQGAFTFFMAGDFRNADAAKAMPALRIQQAFSRHPEYWLRNVSPDPVQTPDGFKTTPPPQEIEDWTRFGPARMAPSSEALRPPTDDWPFLYLHSPMIPDQILTGMAIMGGIAALLLFAFYPRGEPENGGAVLGARMFFLGAGFMLIETKAVVHMALLFGGSWIVNSVVFFAVLVMILCANVFVQTVKPKNLVPYYAGLLLSLGLNVLVPLDSFLGMSRVVQIALSCSLVFAPILFAGVIFAVSFARVGRPDRAFGFNVAGAMAGGLIENSSMLLGFQYLVAVAAVLYVLSMLSGGKAAGSSTQQAGATP